MKFKIKDILNNGTHVGLDNPTKLTGDPIAVPITYLLLRFTKITPNSVTMVSLILGFTAAIAIFMNVSYLPIILFYFAYVFDFVDGTLARMLSLSSAEGKKLDIRVDRAIFTAIAISYVYLFLSSNRLVETFLLIVYTLLFFYVDIVEYSHVVYGYMTNNSPTSNKVSKKKRYGELTWFKSLFNIKLWIPRRAFTIPLVFVIAPLIGNFTVCCILAIGIIIAINLLPPLLSSIKFALRIRKRH